LCRYQELDIYKGVLTSKGIERELKTDLRIPNLTDSNPLFLVPQLFYAVDTILYFIYTILLFYKIVLVIIILIRLPIMVKACGPK
jgi:hypothetical protein